jgi:hypothetical protein
MSTFSLRKKFLARWVLAALVCAVSTAGAAPQQSASVPDFFSNGVGWVGIGGDFIAVSGARPPVTYDSAHPYVPNGTSAQPTFRIADLSNPNLKPWVKERMKKDNDEVLAGKIAFTPRASCMPAGVPAFMNIGGLQPVFFIPNAQAGVDNLFRRSAGTARLSRRAPFG